MLDFIGSIKMDVAAIDAMKAAGVNVAALSQAGLVEIHPPEQPHPPQAAGRRRQDRLYRRRRHRRPVARRRRRTTSTGATPISASQGPVVGQMQAVFNDNWTKATGARARRRRTISPRWTRRAATTAQMFSSSPTGGSESMHLMYLMAINAARHSIHLSASYFVPDELAIKALVAAAQARRRRAHHHARPGHRFRHRARRLARALGRPAEGRHQDGRIPAHHVPREGADRRFD